MDLFQHCSTTEVCSESDRKLSFRCFVLPAVDVEMEAVVVVLDGLIEEKLEVVVVVVATVIVTDDVKHDEQSQKDSIVH